MLVQACTYLDKSWKSDTPKLCVFIRAHRDSCLGSSNSSIDEQPFPGAWLCEHRCVPRPSSAVFVFLEPIRPEVYVCADVYDITQSLESLDVEHAIGFTHTGRSSELRQRRSQTRTISSSCASTPAAKPNSPTSQTPPGCGNSSQPRSCLPISQPSPTIRSVTPVSGANSTTGTAGAGPSSPGRSMRGHTPDRATFRLSVSESNHHIAGRSCYDYSAGNRYSRTYRPAAFTVSVVSTARPEVS